MTTKHKLQDVGKQNYTVIESVKQEITFTWEVRNDFFKRV